MSIPRTTFTTTVRLVGRSALAFAIPIDVRAVFGRARPPVLVTINGHTFATTPGVRGGETYVVVNRDARAASGVSADEEVEVTLTLDTQPRVVKVPDDLAGALSADPGAAAGFEALSYSHLKEYVDWIEEAKRPETRARRVAGTLERVREGRTQR